jgi:hypothetical protein
MKPTITYLFIVEGNLFCFVCHIEISQIIMLLAMFLVPNVESVGE